MTPQPILSVLIFGFWMLAYYFGAWYAYRAYWKAIARGDENNATPLRYFMWMFFWMGTFFIFHWLPVIAFYIGGPYATLEAFSVSHPWSHLMGHIFMHISFAYGALIAAHFSWPSLKPYVFGWVVIWGALIGTPITIRFPQVTNVLGPIITGGDSPIVGMITALGALGFLYAGIVFLFWMFKSKDSAFRIRSLLLGLGFILFFIGGPLNDSAGTLAEMIPAYTIVTAAILLKIIGLTIKRGDLKPASTYAANPSY